MRFPVFARGSNPAIDRPIQRKSKHFVTGEVDAGRADWIDPSRPELGILCREFLYFGEKLVPAKPEDISKLRRLPPVEVSGLRFEEPGTKKWLTEDRHRRTQLLIQAGAVAYFGRGDMVFLSAEGTA